MKSKYITLLLIALSAFLTSACKTSFTNLTPQRVPENPSNIYTLSFAAKIPTADAIEESLRAYITIDGNTHPMVRTAKDSRIFEYEYAMPSNRKTARYYFTLKYDSDVNGSAREREQVSNLETLTLANRYVISMQAERGPVGEEIPVVGRGFNRFDKIRIGGFEAETFYASSVALSFIVPPLPANEDYSVVLVTGNNELGVGSFRIDPSKIRISPSSLELKSGQIRHVLFSIQRPAPEGGLSIEVTTDKPASIIMPEAIIPAGKQTISVPIEAGAAGEGTLFIRADGFEELDMPVRIKPNPNATPTNTSTLIESEGVPSDSEDKTETIDAESLILEE